MEIWFGVGFYIIIGMTLLVVAMPLAIVYQIEHERNKTTLQLEREEKRRMLRQKRRAERKARGLWF